MITKNETEFGKDQIQSSANEYGFWVKFLDCYETRSTTMFGRIDYNENDAYFSGGPKRVNIDNMNLLKKNAYLSKYSLTCMEEVRFESELHARDYFRHHRDRFWKTYPKFKNQKPIDHYGKDKRNWDKL